MSKKLLITDDALIIREMIKNAVIEDGWEVVGEACNGQEAIDKYIELKPDLVTLDLVMPESDGLCALQGIMEFDKNANVVVVSAIEQDTVLKKAFKMGATDFIVKPFSKRGLLATLQKSFENKEPAGVG